MDRTTETLRSPNFAFLEEHEPLLVQYGALAERYVFDDPNTCLIKLRQLAECLANTAAAHAGIYLREEQDFVHVLQRLSDTMVLTTEVCDLFHGLRKAGNQAAHQGVGSRSDALFQLKMARQVAIWFHRTFGNSTNFKPGPFTPPPNPADTEQELRDELDKLRADLAKREQIADSASAQDGAKSQQLAEAEQQARQAYEELEVALSLAQETEQQLNAEREQFQTQLASVQASAASAPSQELLGFIQKSEQASHELDISEADTRRQIDEQLREAGWDADTIGLSFDKGVRPHKGKNLAIAEWPTKKGFADYVLFTGLKPIAIVEAKRRAKDVPAALEQAKVYSRDYVTHADEVMPGGPWDDYQIPFLFATNGRPYLKQIATKSGVWFLDKRRPTNIARALEDWYTPEGLTQLLSQDHDAAEEELRTDPPDYLPLREYQSQAIRAVENAITGGQRQLLLAMATGTGKTRTAICLIYRLIKARRFRRVLFLVDRTALGEQATNNFKDLHLVNNQTFADIYDVKELGDLRPDTETKIHFATVQGMMRRILYPGDETLPIPIDAYDCIVVDECHRGYNLDREMSDTELTFRDERDYISKYSRVLDHFDAVKIGLTATPALHTTELFGTPVFEYSYRKAVIDGFLIDHEPPLRIITKLAQDGMTWQIGEEMEVYEPKTGQLDLINVPDEVNIEIEEYNRRVVTENFNRAVCGELVRHIDPTLPGKTLVFCATDQHADLVVTILKDAFQKQYGSIEDDAVVKITGAAYKPSKLIRQYKNERLPNVAVTVDLVTTGIDVPEIENLVFIRRVKSRILYEQMLGRATRLCPEIDKETFRIFDAVDLYSCLEDVINMRPVTPNPNIKFATLIKDMEKVQDDTILQDLKEQLLAKLQRKKRTFEKSDRDEFVTATGMEPDELINKIRESSPEEIVTWFVGQDGAADFLDRVTAGGGSKYVISHHEDEVRIVEHGYGDGKKPEDYLESFGDFVKSNLNEIPALMVVTQRPRELTRQQLKELKLLLDREGYTETNLRTAHRDVSNQDIAASIIGYIRQVALGCPLVPYNERVRLAMDKIQTSRQWTGPQRKWLDRIGKQLLVETVVDHEALDRGQFGVQGGFNRLNKVFDGQLDHVLGEIQDAVWTDSA